MKLGQPGMAAFGVEAGVIVEAENVAV